jgi:hypothetical protein
MQPLERRKASQNGHHQFAMRSGCICQAIGKRFEPGPGLAVCDELATATAERVVAGNRTIEIARVRITEAGRRALAPI